ncbi:MAG TPA: RNA polymerase sigma factor [Streptosporangiaceae bacterium]|nr:RNA polymerase sigma factor [Streptosporangiaceae bacterium]
MTEQEPAGGQPLAARGDEDADRFCVIYAQNRERVYAYAVSKAGSGLADEILSEVFMVAWRRLEVVPDPPLPWLLAVARNVAMSQSRTTAKERSAAQEMNSWLSRAEITVADVADSVTDRLTVLAALAELSEPDREVLTLVAWHGLSAQAAARVIGCSTATFFVRLHRARRRLESAIARAESEPESTVTGLSGAGRDGVPAGDSDLGLGEREKRP